MDQKKEIKKPLKYKGQVFTSPDIVSYKVQEIVEKVGDNPNDFVIKRKVVEVDRVSRKAYINSFKNDVGIQNILRKVAISGENVEQVVSSGRFASKQKGLVDISKVPDNLVDTVKAVEAGLKAYDKLPRDFKEKYNILEASKISNLELKKYINDTVDSIVKKTEKKKEEVK